MSAEGWVYLLEGGPYWKIGRAKDPLTRKKMIDLALPFPVRFVCAFHSSDYRAAEKNVHLGLAEYRVGGEWFVFPEDEGFLPWVHLVTHAYAVDFERGVPPKPIMWGDDLRPRLYEGVPHGR
jgi:hypothetical protein